MKQISENMKKARKIENTIFDAFLINKNMKKILLAILMIVTVVMAGCSNQTINNDDAQPRSDEGTQTKVFKIGVIVPLSGDVAVYGETTQRVQKKAVEDINAQWKAQGKNQEIELIFEDGKCDPKTSLIAAQNLVNVKNVKIILGGFCSGETLGAAPFTEANRVILLSSTATSPEIANAGDYVFRNIGSDSYQAVIAANKITKDGHTKIAIMSENTAYGEALRKTFIKQIENNGGEIVIDEVIETSQKDLNTQMLKIKNSGAQALFVIPQSDITGAIYAKYMKSGNLENVAMYGGEVFTFGKNLEAAPNGMIVFKQGFDESDLEFQKMIMETKCDVGLYCASIYDSVVLISQIIEVCGEDTGCIKDKLYATQNWEGKYQGSISFDSNGDIATEFNIFEINNGELIKQT